MKNCPECKIQVGGPGTYCPLCGSKLVVMEKEECEDALYPDFSKPVKPRSKFPPLAKIFAFISLAAVFICGLIDALISHQLTWSLYVIGGIAAAWVSVGTHLLTDINLNYKLLIDLCALSFYLVLIDRLTGWHGWSLAYVLPIGFVLLVFVIIAVGRGAQLRLEEYIIYIFVAMLLSMLQIIPVLTHLNPFILPAVISMALLLIEACAAVIFRFRDLRSAVQKLFNL